MTQEIVLNPPPESLLYFIAGMLSTIDFTPSITHPERMLNMADKVIQHVRRMDQQDRIDKAEQSEDPF